MKLLFVYSANFKKDSGGNYYTGGSINEQMWKRYTSISDELSIISRLDKCEYDSDFAKKNFNAFNHLTKKFIPIPNLYSNILGFMSLKLRKNYNKIIKENVKEHDLIIARLPSNAGQTAIKYAKKYKKSYLVEVVGCPWDAYWNHSLKGKLIAPFMYYSTKKRVRDAEHVIYVTNEFLQKRYPTNGKYTNCSNVSLTEFNDDILKARLERISKIDKHDKIIIGTTAAVDVRYKGQQYVIKALAQLRKRGIINYEYQLVGGGDQSYLGSLARKHNVSEQVIFLGCIPHDEVFKWLDTIDIYVQPSRQEGLPRALIEAMSRGLPVFGARTGGIPELLEQEFVFSNTKKNIDEICSILKSFDKATMLSQAKRNYEESKKYDKSIIEVRRTQFLKNFINEAAKNQVY